MNPGKHERLEDLGIIYEKLDRLIRDFESDYPYFDSKHSYDTFQQKMVADDCDKLYDFHCRLRYVVSELNEILCLAQGEVNYDGGN